MSGQSSSGSKTEKPTPKKLRDARKKGQVARSQEVVTTVSLISVIAYIWLTWDAILARLVELFNRAAKTHGSDFRSTVHTEIAHAFSESIFILLPILCIVVAFGVAANYTQFGSIFAFEPITPKFEKINPSEGFKRIFSMKQMVEFLKSIFKIAFLSALLIYVFRSAISPYMNSIYCGLPCIYEVTGSLIEKTLLFSGLAFIIVAIFDLAYQKRHHYQSMMMTKSEVKREFKENEGDPIVKRKRKELRDELLLSDGMERTENATALVINPTHFAVAIDYKPDKAPLPVIVAKGTNLYAHMLRSKAESSGVPVFLNVPMARALYADGQIDGFVPDEWFRTVAEILAWVNVNRELLYSGPLKHGVIDMESGDHLGAKSTAEGEVGWDLD